MSATIEQHLGATTRRHVQSLRDTIQRHCRVPLDEWPAKALDTLSAAATALQLTPPVVEQLVIAARRLSENADVLTDRDAKLTALSDAARTAKERLDAARKEMQAADAAWRSARLAIELASATYLDLCGVRSDAWLLFTDLDTVADRLATARRDTAGRIIALSEHGAIPAPTFRGV